MNGSEQNKTIWTIGHSTRSLDEFINMLQSFQIKCIVDVRSYPGSKRYPHYNKEALDVSLIENDIKYIHIKELGGRRKTRPDSINMGWRHASFRGYADYMETESFNKSIMKLENIACKERTAYMCSEAVWWRCHRSLISDYLKVNGWTVIHIMGIGKGEEHPYTTPARIAEGHLSYSNENNLIMRFPKVDQL